MTAPASSTSARAAAAWALGAGSLAAALVLNYVTGRHLERIGPGLAPARDLLLETLPFAAFFITAAVARLARRSWRALAPGVRVEPEIREIPSSRGPDFTGI